MKEEFLKHLQRILREDQRALEENMSSHVTFRTGGPAEYYVRPNRQQIQPVLELCRRFDVPWMVIGNGSNLLVGDRGIRGLVMEIGRMMDRISIDGELVTAEAGALLSSAARYAAKESLTGMEFASGIPGTVGGAVVMNAGAYGGEIKQLLKSVTVLTEDGQERELGAEELDLGYRHSCILERRLIVLEAKLQLSRGNPEEISDRMEELKNRRVEKQPLEYPSAGSTFKRPEGYFAGKLIQDTGLRGYQVGGAQVSEKHCGFVINREKAVSKDIRQLITDVQDQVEAQFGVRLEPEVKFIGDF